MAIVIKSNKALITKEGLSPHKRPEIQGFLEEAVSLTVKQLSITQHQRDQHRVLRALIRMSCRVALWLGSTLGEHLALVKELFVKCEADMLTAQKKLPPASKSSKPNFHNSMKELKK
jgi:hypothetical protein